MIEINQLYKKYPKNDFFSLYDFSLQITKGEIYGLLGPNGAGKTTLISILCGLIPETTGQVSIGGLNYTQNRKVIQEMIGVVPQEYALYPTLTAFENLEFLGSMYGLEGKLLKTKINEGIEKLGLMPFAHKRIDSFSGGMKRRINLLAGILHNPSVLFLDEPTVGVDIQSKKVIINYLQEIQKSGTTILYTSHHLKEAEEFCSQVAIIDTGKLITHGSPQALIIQTPEANNLEDVFITITGKNLRDYV